LLEFGDMDIETLGMDKTDIVWYNEVGTIQRGQSDE